MGVLEIDRVLYVLHMCWLYLRWTVLRSAVVVLALTVDSWSLNLLYSKCCDRVVVYLCVCVIVASTSRALCSAVLMNCTQKSSLKPATHWWQSWIQHGRLCWKSTMSLWRRTHRQQSRLYRRHCRLRQAVEFKICRQNRPQSWLYRQQSRPHRRQSTFLPICRRFRQQSGLSPVCTGLYCWWTVLRRAVVNFTLLMVECTTNAAMCVLVYASIPTKLCICPSLTVITFTKNCEIDGGGVSPSYACHQPVLVDDMHTRRRLTVMH